MRHTAKLDSLHTISRDLIDDGVECRVARLSADFRRDLQIRLAQSFSRTGFDDYAWYSMSDLEYLVTMGQRQLAALEGDLADLKLKLGQETARGGEANPHKVKNLGNEIANLERDLELLKEELLPYENELGARAADEQEE